MSLGRRVGGIFGESEPLAGLGLWQIGGAFGLSKFGYGASHLLAVYMFLYQAVLYFCQLFGCALRKLACMWVFLFVDGGVFEAPCAYFFYDGQQVDAF